MLRQGRHRGGSFNGVEGEGPECEPVGALQKKISVGLVLGGYTDQWQEINRHVVC